MILSQTAFRKIRPTLVTDFIVMPDVQIVCTSSTERDLCFYDTVAKKFELRVMVKKQNLIKYSTGDLLRSELGNLSKAEIEELRFIQTRRKCVCVFFYDSLNEQVENLWKIFRSRGSRTL